MDKYQEAFRLTMESFRNDIERHAVAVRIQLPIAPVRPKARRKQIVQRNTSERYVFASSWGRRQVDLSHGNAGRCRRR